MLRAFDHEIAFVLKIIFSVILLPLFSETNFATPNYENRILCHPKISMDNRHELAKYLRSITGWSELTFDKRGTLQTGQHINGGSKMARELLISAANSGVLSVIQEANGHSDVIFARVNKAVWKNPKEGNRPPAYIIFLDFNDFSQLTGDEAALAAFNVGWALLHELAHIIYDANDAVNGDDLGECEDIINQMRRECGLAERSTYYSSVIPGTEAGGVKVARISFEQQDRKSLKRKRYWLIWDVRLVGELKDRKYPLIYR
jgi:hypothetical protein